jgi:protein-disulfide isomerase
MTAPSGMARSDAQGWLLLLPLAGLLAGSVALMVRATQAPLDPISSVGAHVRGDPGALSELVVWTDLQCPVCRDFDLSVVPRLERTALADGRLKLVYRHFIARGGDSARAAEATECAAEQGRFWAYRRRLQGEYSVRANDAHNDVNLRRYAVELGLDRPAFDACFNAGRYAALIVLETEAGRAAGITGVPTVVSEGRILHPPADLPRILEPAGVAARR